MSSKQTYMLVGVIAAFVLGGIIFALTRSSSDDQNTAKDTQQTNSENSGVQGLSEQTTQNRDSRFSERFVAYSDENLKQATGDGGKAIIFFHASWCPVCSEAEADLKANWDKVPADVTILKTDYDSARELKAKYGVVSQDTWVQVDDKGNEVTKWNSGGQGLASLLANLTEK